MNASPKFRYYLALMLLILLSLAIRVQNGADVTERPALGTTPAPAAPAGPLVARQ